MAKDIPQEYLNLVRFFGPAYPAHADMALVPDPTNLLPCNVDVAMEFESALYRSGDAQTCCAKSTSINTYAMKWAGDAGQYVDGHAVSMRKIVVIALCP